MTSWKKILGIDTFSIASGKILDDIIEYLFEADKIDLEKFVINYEALKNNFRLSVAQFFKVEKKKKTTPSLSYFHNPMRIAQAFPLWFYASYPDVMAWFHEWQKEQVRKHKCNTDIVSTETAKLCGIDKNVNIQELIDKEKQYTPKFLRMLVDSYIRETNNKLELSSN